MSHAATSPVGARADPGQRRSESVPWTPSVRGLTPSDLIDVWERTAGLHPIDGALAVLGVAARDPGARDATRDDLARLPLGIRDAALLRVRRETLGDPIEARCSCPACGTKVELTLSCGSMLEVVAGAMATGEVRADAWDVELEGFNLRLRALDSHDAAVAASLGSEDDARKLLITRAVVAASCGRGPVAADELPAAVVGSIAGELAAHDAAVEILLSFTCPECGATWADVLDAATFVVAELAARGARVLEQVDCLARAYGWSEAAILNLGERRRAAYVARVEA